MSPLQHIFYLQFFNLKIYLLTSCAETPGHMKQFGYNAQETVDEHTGFQISSMFFKNYVKNSEPLIMRQAVIYSSAFQKWQTDEYFLSLENSNLNEMLIETRKKENRSQNAINLKFKEFIQQYNSSELYMVNSVPDFLMEDVPLPGPLQCSPIYQSCLVGAMMWFSSGGTKSVVHTDSVDNINCLYSGQKEFILVNPHKYGNYVDLDHPEGAYSSMDVDSVDFNRYPGMVNVSYKKAVLQAGDCLYIPYLWIHQVRSFNRNIAVNLWWDHKESIQTDFSLCTDEFNPKLSLKGLNFRGLDEFQMKVKVFRNLLNELVDKHTFISFDVLADSVGRMTLLDEVDGGRGFVNPLKKIFKLIDKDQSFNLSEDEVKFLDETTLQHIEEHLNHIGEMVKAFQELFESKQDQLKSEL